MSCRRCGFVYPWGNAARIARVTALNGLCPACFTGKASPVRLTGEQIAREHDLAADFARAAAAALRPRPAPRVRVGCCLRCAQEKELMAHGDCRACYWAGIDTKRATA